MKKHLDIIIFTLLLHFTLDLFLGFWPFYKNVLGFKLTTAAAISGLAGFVGEGSQIWFGNLIQKNSGNTKKLLYLGILCLMTCTCCTLTQNVYLLGIFITISTVGSGILHPVATDIITRYHPHPRQAISCFSAAGVIGFGLSQCFFAFLLKNLPGHIYPVLFLNISLLLYLLYSSHSFEENPYASPTRVEKGSFLHAFKWLYLPQLYITQIFTYGFLIVFIFLLPELLIEKSMSPWFFQGGGHCLLISGGFLSLVGLSFQKSKQTIKKHTLSFFACTLVFLYLLIFTPSNTPAYVAVLLVLLGMSLYVLHILILTWGTLLIPQGSAIVSSILMGGAWSIAYFFPFILITLLPDKSIINILFFGSLSLWGSMLLLLQIPNPSSKQSAPVT